MREREICIWVYTSWHLCEGLQTTFGSYCGFQGLNSEVWFQTDCVTQDNLDLQVLVQGVGIIGVRYILLISDSV